MRSCWLLFLLAGFIFVDCINVDAAKKEFRFEKIDFGYRTVSAQDTTVKGLGKGKLTALGKPQGWGAIETLYESLPEWADDVEIRYYVLLKAKTKKNGQVMLAGSVSYVHVESGKHHCSNVYIPPQVLRRYGDVLRIRAEIWYNGVLQDDVQWPGKKATKTPWWTRVKPTYGSLMNRFYTPFEHEAQLKEEVIKVQ